MAASKSGLAVVPFWGRATRLDGPASGDSVAIADSPWIFHPDDLVFFTTPEPGTWEIRTVTGATETTLTLDAPLSRTYYDFVWPLLFGRFRSGSLKWLNLSGASVLIDVEQLEVVPDPAPSGDPVETYESYLIGFTDLMILNGGSGWSGAWDTPLPQLGVLAPTDFELSALGLLHGSSGGSGWNGTWNGTAAVLSGVQATETFESYDDSADLNGGTGGAGWEEGWSAN